MMSLIGRLPIPHRIAGFALTGTLFVLMLLGLAHHNFRGEIVELSPAGSSELAPMSLLRVAAGASAVEATSENSDSDAPIGPYYVFLQKFPLESSFKKLFHTEVVVCPRKTFADDDGFLEMLDGKVATLAPSRFDDATADLTEGSGESFVAIDQREWSRQFVEGCIQLGYGGANCGMGCCGSPHKHENTHYALSSREAVISNAMGEYKELYLYGVSGSLAGEGTDAGISGEDAYKSVCHGHMNAVEMGQKPKCVSNWAGRDYNPLTNNCNTFTSAVLKCVYGLSDAKPHLGVSDLINVSCPTEEKDDGAKVERCVLPKIESNIDILGEDSLSLH